MGAYLNKFKNKVRLRTIFKVFVFRVKDWHAINKLLYVSLLKEKNSGQNFKHYAFRKE